MPQTAAGSVRAEPDPRATIAFVVVLALFSIAYFATIRAGHYWGDDFAMYILQARNLLEGRALGAGYLFNPEVPLIGPPTYPPVTSLVLAPVYAGLGTDLVAMKAALLLFFLLAQVPLFLLARRHLPGFWPVACVALTLAQPLYWQSKDTIGSDLVFFFPLFCALWWADARLGRPEPNMGRRAVDAVVLGSLIFLAYETRSVAVVMIPAVLAFDVLKSGRLRGSFSIPATVLALLLIAIKRQIGPEPASYPRELFELDPRHFIDLSVAYTRLLAAFWENVDLRPLGWCVGAATLALASWGAWRVETRRLTILPIFAMAYVGCLLIFAVPSDRYLFVLYPIVVFYALCGAADWMGNPRGVAPVALRASLLVLLALTLYGHVGLYRTLERGPIREGWGDSHFREMAEVIRTQTPPDARIVFRKPRLLALLSHREVAVYPLDGAPSEIARYVQSADVGYLVSTEKSEGIFAPDARLREFLQHHASEVTRVDQRGPYTLYAYHLGGVPDDRAIGREGGPPRGAPERASNDWGRSP